MTNYPTLGEMVRALRHGYNWSEELMKFVRLSGRGPFTIDLVLPGSIPASTRAGKGSKYVVWWETAETRRLLIDAIKASGIPSGTFVLDDNGKVI